MNITLYWIPGISKTDTPVFLSLEAQEAYFADCERKVVSTGFYPPYFRNAIKFDADDLDLTTWYPNYVSLVFNDKTFYYFIVEKRYISESIVEVTIEMDTIQTYMFDVKWVNSMLERLTINRVDADGVINRDFIRENLSENQFSKVSNYNIYNRDLENSFDSTINWERYIIIKYAESLNNQQPDIVSTSHFIADSNRPEREYYLTPYNYGLSSYRQGLAVDSDGTVADARLSFDFYCHDIAEDPNVLDMYLIPFHAIDGIECVQAPTPTDLAQYKYSSSRYHIKVIDNCNILVPGGTNVIVGPLPSYVNKVNAYHQISYNTTLGTSFSAFYVPAMFDENYTKIRFGDGSVKTEYPLSTLTSFEIKYSYWADLSSGSLYYNIYPADKDPLYNEHNTITANISGYHLDLKSDPWKEYLANNRYTLAGAFISSGVTLLASAGLGAIKPVAGEMASISSLGKGVKNISHYFVNKENLKHAPDAIKRVGNLMSDSYSESFLVTSTVQYCDDFEDVARYYESNGYKVALYMTTSLFAIDIRYFYDYVQTKEINVQLGDRNTQEDFENRFNDGLRMWHTDSEGLLRARDYGLELGQVCKLDNLENFFIQ